MKWNQIATLAALGLVVSVFGSSPGVAQTEPGESSTTTSASTSTVAPPNSVSQSSSTTTVAVAQPVVVSTTAPTTTAPITTGPTTTAATTTAPTSTNVPPLTLKVAFAGDVLTHAGVVRAACGSGVVLHCDFGRLLAPTRPIVESADLAICHLEVPVAPPGTRWSGYPTFGAPPEIAEGLVATGWDRCSTASNHSLDKGTAGIDATLDALDRAGLRHSGTARSADEGVAPVFDVRGVRVAHLAYAYGFNGFRRPTGQPWRVNLLDPEAIVDDAIDARTRGAEIVIVSIHWGTEYRSAPNAQQQSVARVVTASGQVDLIVGHHAHVIQPIQQINNRWVVFGMGNHLSAQRFQKRPASTEDGALVTVEFTEDPPSRGTGSRRFWAARPVVHPTWVSPGRVVWPVVEALGSPDLTPAFRRAMSASLARSRAVLGPYVVS